MNALRIEFGKNVRKYRKLRGLSQEQLAEKVDVAMKTVSQWENGKTFIEHKNLQKLCEVLGVNEDQLLGTFPKSNIKTISNEINNIVIQLPEEQQKQLLEFLKTFTIL